MRIQIAIMVLVFGQLASATNEQKATSELKDCEAILSAINTYVEAKIDQKLAELETKLRQELGGKQATEEADEKIIKAYFEARNELNNEYGKMENRLWHTMDVQLVKRREELRKQFGDKKYQELMNVLREQYAAAAESVKSFVDARIAYEEAWAKQTPRSDLERLTLNGFFLEKEEKALRQKLGDKKFEELVGLINPGVLAKLLSEVKNTAPSNLSVEARVKSFVDARIAYEEAWAKQTPRSDLERLTLTGFFLEKEEKALRQKLGDKKFEELVGLFNPGVLAKILSEGKNPGVAEKETAKVTSPDFNEQMRREAIKSIITYALTIIDLEIERNTGEISEREFRDQQQKWKDHEQQLRQMVGDKEFDEIVAGVKERNLVPNQEYVPLVRIHVNANVAGLTWSHSKIFVQSFYKDVQMFDAASGLNLGSFDGIKNFDVSPDGTKILGLSGNRIIIKSVATQEIISDAKFDERDRASMFRWSPDGKRFVTVTNLDPSQVTVWDADHMEIISQWRINQNSNSVSWSPGGEQIILSGQRTSIWNVYGQQLNEIRSARNRDADRIADYSPDGRFVLTSNLEQLVVSNATTLKELYSYQVRHSTAKFSPDGTKILMVSKDGIATIMDTKTGAIIATFKISNYRTAYWSYNRKNALADWSGGNSIVTACDGQIIIWGKP